MQEITGYLLSGQDGPFPWMAVTLLFGPPLLFLAVHLVLSARRFRKGSGWSRRAAGLAFVAVALPLVLFVLLGDGAEHLTGLMGLSSLAGVLAYGASALLSGHGGRRWDALYLAALLAMILAPALA